ncbi:beta-propeller domain-containing protein [Methanocaldococcus fervens]|uniref:Beta propeller domain protein n=1 Tax=Methanocaldococcus fervens (strain DSM 4213 / JCM 15782 / AG86) TaxID=573064 RepID=C7P5B2_METFA|nr:beta-propeller domain-containing protein [Methanocaldococcus fervens]ACV25290.1 Beta propeller domain protein [Methanocaldococcus fervens AG86]
MKKILIFGLVILVAISFCGCFEKPESSEDFKLMPANSKIKFEEFKNNLNLNYQNYYASREIVSAEEKAVEPGRYSETNVQVKGVDEADILKTNGNVIAFSSYKTYLIKPLPPEDADIIYNLSQSGRLYLINDTLIVIGWDKITSYNISNPKNPKKLWEMDLEGSYVDSRLYNGNLYLVVRNNSIECPIVWNGYKIGYEKYYIPELPPIYTRDFDITYIISKVDVKTGKVKDSVAVVGNYRTTLYMSKNNLYFAYHLKTNEQKLMLDFLKENVNKYFPEEISDKINKVIENKDFGDNAKYVEITETIEKYLNTLPSEKRYNLMKELENDFENYLEEHWEEYEFTGIAKINLKNFEVKSGKVSGHLINNFAMDEYNGYLRIATTIGDWRFREKTTNNIYILDENLNIVGNLTGLEKGERIYAVRFMGDKAYVVTYKETDPLLVVDLKDPKNPKILGELKIPGYSTYLHPIGNNLFICIGKDDDGKLKISLFDISDLKNPKEVDKYKLNEWWSPALWDYHVFLWDEKYRIFFFPANNHAYIFKVEDNKIEMVKDDKHKTAVLRALFINDYLYTFSYSEMHVLDENNWHLIKKVSFDFEGYPP